MLAKLARQPPAALIQAGAVIRVVRKESFEEVIDGTYLGEKALAKFVVLADRLLVEKKLAPQLTLPPGLSQGKRLIDSSLKVVEVPP